MGIYRRANGITHVVRFDQLFCRHLCQLLFTASAAVVAVVVTVLPSALSRLLKPFCLFLLLLFLEVQLDLRVVDHECSRDHVTTIVAHRQLVTKVSLSLSLSLSLFLSDL